MKEIVKKARSYRRFDGTRKMTEETLRELVDLGRLSPCGGNKQYIKYIISASPDMNAKIYDCLGWAGYLSDWDGPKESERPTGYIILLRDLAIQSAVSVDEGIAAQSIFLGAVAAGYGGCMLMNLKREALMQVLGIDSEKYAVSMVIALGVPVEEVEIVPMPEDGNYRYYRDENQIHYVPKRSLEDVIVKEYE